GELDDESLLLSARRKLVAFLKVSHTPKFRSEARGWLARTDYLLGDQTAAGKIYIDELNRNGSNLSRETLLNSLRINYGYNGGQELLDHLDEYFDTPEHAAFAIQLVTNPGEPGDSHPLRGEEAQPFEKDRLPDAYPRIKSLLQEHATLFQSNAGSQALALLTMRTALRMGDPTGAKEMAAEISASATVRADPDFNWMLASALFLSHDYAGAEQPLLALFHSSRASSDEQAAAAYGLCGVYRKTGNVAEQIRFALWLNASQKEKWASVPLVADLTVYWAGSGWDLGLLLDAEASIDAIRSFVDRNPDLTGIPLVKYSLAVRLARENRYGEAAELYRSIGAVQRASRMERMAALYEAASRAGLADHEAREARYQMAAFLSANPETIYFNGRLWSGFQRYALQASRDSRLTRAERVEEIALERKLKDDQEERWRAYLIFRDIARDEGRTALGRKAALAGLRCLRGISDRFERGDEIRKADLELTRWLR
ncbi:MAG TPA: hypothetical protein VHB50_18115, partial [Bryobacteraceae bacterium]|nr:hypothetical protein [Bryobacteraceae bacterium]